MSTERLLKIKSQIDEAIPEQAEVAGQIKAVTSQVEQKFKIKTLPEMKKELEEIGKKIDGQESSFKEDMEELENAYPWE